MDVPGRLRIVFTQMDPLDELVSSLLSHRTKNADSARAFRQLREGFPDWESVRDAPVAEVEAAIAPCTWPCLLYTSPSPRDRG